MIHDPGNVTARDRVHIKFCRARSCYIDAPDPALSAQTCRLLDHLLDKAGDDRAHREAERLRQRASLAELGVGPFAEGQRQLIRQLADLADPYELREGQLVLKTAKERNDD